MTGFKNYNMRKLACLLLFVAVFTACEKDDEVITSVTPNIEEWVTGDTITIDVAVYENQNR